MKAGDTITVTLEVTEKKDKRCIVILDCTVLNQHNKRVVTGTAEVMAATEKLVLESPEPPRVQIGD